MTKNKSMESPAYDPEAYADFGSKECKNMMDYTVDDDVSFSGTGKIKRISSDNGVRMSMKIMSVKLSEGKKESKKDGEKFPAKAFMKEKK